MMNKKAIAAFAAGATLLAGFAMATPAFAADSKGDKKTECKVDAKKAHKAAVAVNAAQAGVYTAQEKVDTKQEAANKAQAAVDAATPLVTEYNDAVEAKTKAVEDKNTAEDKDQADVVIAQAKARLSKAIAAAKKNSDLKDAAKDKTVENAAKDDLKNALAGLNTKLATDNSELYVAQGELGAAQAKLTKAESDLAKAECKDAPKKDPDHKDKDHDQDPTPVPSSKSEHIGLLYALLSKLNDAKADMNNKLDDYHKLFTKVAAAKADMEAAGQAKAAADQAVQDALAAGLNDSNPSAFKDLTERAARAQAHFAAATKTYNELYAEFEKVYAKAKQASDAYNKALTAYKDELNAALAAGVKLPGDLPVLTDPLAELNLPVPAGVPTPNVPGVGGFVPGKPGKPGKPEVEKKKNDGKKLPGTGVGVTLTALAATMLAGMGAAVRKARH